MIASYLDTNDSILLKSSDKAFHVLYHIIMQTNQETNIWYNDKINKINIIEALNIASSTLEKHIATLKKKNLIIPTLTKRGIYSLNLDILSI